MIAVSGILPCACIPGDGSVACVECSVRSEQPQHGATNPFSSHLAEFCDHWVATAPFWLQHAFHTTKTLATQQPWRSGCLRAILD